MKEQLYTIPLNDALQAEDECPFCYLERCVEQDMLDFILGSASSYMESDVRSDTDKAGFCRNHLQKMFDYGNTLGSGWILKTHYEHIRREMDEQFKHFHPVRLSLKDKFKKAAERQNGIGIWIAAKEQSCYICNHFEETFARYLDTFLILYQKDTAFRKKVLHSKGFCLHHFGYLCEAAEMKLKDSEKETFFKDMFLLMDTNMERVHADIAWLVEKFDYRNKDADWKSSKDAIQRGMQKLHGGYPADSDYKQNK